MLEETSCFDDKNGVKQNAYNSYADIVWAGRENLVVSGLTNHKKQDKIPFCLFTFSAKHLKEMRQVNSKKIKKNGCFVIVFKLY